MLNKTKNKRKKNTRRVDGGGMRGRKYCEKSGALKNGTNCFVQRKKAQANVDNDDGGE